MTSYIMYFLRMSIDVSFQKLYNSPIDEEVEASILSTSYLLQKLYDTNLPRYLKFFVNIINPHDTVMLFV